MPIIRNTLGGVGAESEAQAKLPVVPKQNCPEMEDARDRGVPQTTLDRGVRLHPPAALPLEFPAPMYSIDAGMVDHPSGGKASGPGFLHRTLFRTDHKAIGLQYLWLALLSVFLGMIMSLVMRIHLVWPGARLPFTGLDGSPERYAALTLLHGSLMVLMVLTAAPQAGFGNYLLPIQIGARDMAFPRLNLAALWITSTSLAGVTTAFFLPPQTGLTLWIASIALFCIAVLANALDFSVTTIDLRAKGMTLPRLPVTVWAWFINAILSLLIFSVLLAACVYLLADRTLGTHFFSLPALLPSISRSSQSLKSPLVASAVLWQRLFWFFAQAQVYVSILPCFGITTHLIATFSRKPVWAQRAVVLALCAVGLFGFCIWGQHTFASGLNPYSPLVFSLLASSLGLPASILMISWFGTLWNGKVQLTAAMLFALGFVSLFLAGGLSGLFLARNDLTATAASDDFITGHFHLVMGIAATFAMLGALFFWFPKMFGRSLDERLGKIHFWITFCGVYCVFMPMHWLGMIAHLHLSPEAAVTVATTAASAIRSFVTVATLVTVAAQGIFLFNFVKTLTKRSEAVANNPWRATTLEWSLQSPPPLGNFAGSAPVVYRGAYEFGAGKFGAANAEDFALQSLQTEGGPPATLGGTDPGLQPLPPHAAGTP
jgi:cytochrome c oxidase subunit 1